MRTRIVLVAALLLAVTVALPAAQQKMFRVKLNPTGSMISFDQPVLVGGKWVFHAWPDGEQTALRQAVVLEIKPLTGAAQDAIYQIEIAPSGTVAARDLPVLRTDGLWVFHAWKGGALMSLRQADVRKITILTGDEAFWEKQRLEGGVSIGGDLALEGARKVVEIGTPSARNHTAQAGPASLSDIHGAPAYGNWSYQGTPGVSDAWSPANATMNGGVPTMPAATNGTNPPTTP